MYTLLLIGVILVIILVGLIGFSLACGWTLVNDLKGGALIVSQRTPFKRLLALVGFTLLMECIALVMMLILIHPTWCKVAAAITG